MFAFCGSASDSSRPQRPRDLAKRYGAIIPGSPGSLPNIGKLPTIAGWQPALPRSQEPSLSRLFDFPREEPAKIGEPVQVTQGLDVEIYVVVYQSCDTALSAAAGRARVIQCSRSD